MSAVRPLCTGGRRVHVVNKFVNNVSVSPAERHAEATGTPGAAEARLRYRPGGRKRGVCFAGGRPAEGGKGAGPLLREREDMSQTLQ